jgi:hypothetical protein
VTTATTVLPRQTQDKKQSTGGPGSTLSFLDKIKAD